MRPKVSFITKRLKRPTMEQDAAAGLPEMTHQGLEKKEATKDMESTWERLDILRVKVADS